MDNYRCPRCGVGTISFWQKQLSGFRSQISCSNCGARLKVPLVRSFMVRAVGMFIPFCGVLFAYIFIPFAISGLFPTSEVGLYGAAAIGFIVGCVVVVWATHRFVPLVPTDA
jgi:hypothetical protein